MKITDFVKLPAQEANQKLRDGLKKGTIDIKQFRQLSASWLEEQGLIHTDFGWNTKDELDEMGAYKDNDGHWYLETESVGISKKDGNGKIIHVIAHLPKKAIAYDSQRSQIERAYKGKPLTEDMREKILTSWED